MQLKYQYQPTVLTIPDSIPECVTCWLPAVFLPPTIRPRWWFELIIFVAIYPPWKADWGGGTVGDPWIKMSYRIIIISAAICCRKVPDRLTPPLVILTREDNPRGNWPTGMSTWKRVMGIKSSASSGGSFFLVLPFIIRNGEWKREVVKNRMKPCSNETRR